jgi:hypothetical protein
MGSALFPEPTILPQNDIVKKNLKAADLILIIIIRQL